MQGFARREVKLSDSTTYQKALRDSVVEVERLPTQRECFQALASFSSIGEWAGFCEAHGIYQIVHQELIDDISDVLDRLGIRSEPILEVAAGKGKLSYWLSKQGFVTNPVDDFSWDVELSAYVEPLKHDRALAKYRPEVVIGSWVPTSSSILPDVLSFPSVRYFLHLGNPGFAVHRCQSLLRENGIFYSEVPIRASPAYSSHKAENLGLYTKNN